MNRRSANWVLRILVLAAAITVPLVAATPGDAVAGNPVPTDTVPADTVPTDTVPTDTVPTDTANPFLPEERDLTDCLGLLQRPGCGSEARGGLGQTLVAIAMVGGLVLIFGRVAWGVRRNRGRQALPADADTSAGTAADTAGTDSEGATDDGSESGSAGDQSDGGTVDTAPRGDAS